MSLRLEKVNELIRHHLAEILNREVSWKAGILVTVTKVDTTPDLRYTRVSVSVFPESEQAYAFSTLSHTIRNIQGELNRKLRMRPLPRIEFRSDATEANAQVVEDILKSLE